MPPFWGQSVCGRLWRWGFDRRLCPELHGACGGFAVCSRKRSVCLRDDGLVRRKCDEWMGASPVGGCRIFDGFEQGVKIIHKSIIMGKRGKKCGFAWDFSGGSKREKIFLRESKKKEWKNITEFSFIYCAEITKKFDFFPSLSCRGLAVLKVRV